MKKKYVQAIFFDIRGKLTYQCLRSQVLNVYIFRIFVEITCILCMDSCCLDYAVNQICLTCLNCMWFSQAQKL